MTPLRPVYRDPQAAEQMVPGELVRRAARAGRVVATRPAGERDEVAGGLRSHEQRIASAHETVTGHSVPPPEAA